jgi:hypothetical protein
MVKRVEVNQDVIAKAAERDRLVAAKHAFVITDCEPYESQNNSNAMLLVRERALSDDRDPNSKIGPEVRSYITLPLDVKDESGAVVSVTQEWMANMTLPIIQALFDDVPQLPRFDRESKTLTYEGETIENAQRAACTLDANLKASKKAIEWNKNPKSVVGHTFYATVKYGEDSDFPSLVRWTRQSDGLSETQVERVGVDGVSKSKSGDNGEMKTSRRGAKATSTPTSTRRSRRSARA